MCYEIGVDLLKLDYESFVEVFMLLVSEYQMNWKFIVFLKKQ